MLSVSKSQTNLSLIYAVEPKQLPEELNVAEWTPCWRPSV
jgi:hypothetical protein